MKKALITDHRPGWKRYLADLLLEKGYEVHGIIRRAHNLQYRPHRDHS